MFFKFPQCYFGSVVCAPSRSSFIEGKHTCNSYFRGNINNGKKDELEVIPLTRLAYYG